MNFVGIVLALLLERGLGQVPGWGEPALFRTILRGLHRGLRWEGLWRSHAAPFLILLPPTLLAGAAAEAIEQPLLALLFSSGVLLLCLGPRDLADDIHRWLELRNQGDGAAAETLQRQLMQGPQPDASHRSLLGALFIQSHERLFGVLLWFFVAGPAGAVGYRLASRLPRLLHELVPDSAAAHTSDALHSLLAALPARLTAALYGLAGSLDDAIAAWRSLLSQPHPWRTHTWAILAEVSAASLSMEEEDGAEVVPATLAASLEEVLRMQFRALAILLAGFALYTTGAIL